MRYTKLRFLLILAAYVGGTTMVSAEIIRLYAAGSLKAALSEAARTFEQATPGVRIETEFAASGLLRERIEKGEPAHVFASADTGHPQKLADAARTEGTVTVFARNQLCALAKPGLSVSSETLLDVILDPKIRLGISTPKADPSGDYAVALFARAESVKAGSQAALMAKAQMLTGGPDSPKAPEGRNLYAWVMDTQKADVFLTYCTNAILARKELSALQVVAVPNPFAVGADYGIVMLKGAPDAARSLRDFLVSDRGQSILGAFGFGRGDPVAR